MGAGVVVVAAGARDPARALLSVGSGVPRLVVAVGAHGFAGPEGAEVLRLPENRGYGAGVNAGIARLRARGECDRVLLLNDDAWIDAGALETLARALDDPARAAVGPTVVRARDGRVESCGAAFDPRWGRFQLWDHGRPAPSVAPEPFDAPSLSGAAWMVSLAAFDRVGPLDEAFFAYFEETDWCARARAAGFRLSVVPAVVAHHEGGATLGAASPERLYYSARNNFRAAERALPLAPPASWVRTMSILGANLAHALVQPQVPRAAAVGAVIDGWRDHRGRRYGRRSGPA